MALSEKEQAQLEALTKKSKEPDAPPVGKSLVGHIDFGDQKQIDAAIEHGFLTKKEAEEIVEDDKKEKKGDATPRRRGYFKEPDDE